MRLVRNFSMSSLRRRGRSAPDLLDFVRGIYRQNGEVRSFGDMVTVTRALSAMRQSPAGLLEMVPVDTARFDFGWPQGQSRGLLIEAAATNLVRQSSGFTLTPWVRGRLNAVSGVMAPDGTLTATVLTRSATNDTAYASCPCGASGAATFTASVYAKAGELGGQLALRVQGVYPRKGDAVFDLVGGTVVGALSSLTNTATTATIAPLAHGWYRCVLTTTMVLAENPQLSIVLGPTHLNAAIGAWEAAGPLTDVVVWGAQLEVGTTATTFIPTGAAPVTRPADVPVLNGVAGVHDVELTYDDGTTQILANTTVAPGWWPAQTRPRLRQMALR